MGRTAQAPACTKCGKLFSTHANKWVHERKHCRGPADSMVLTAPTLPTPRPTVPPQVPTLHALWKRCTELQAQLVEVQAAIMHHYACPTAPPVPEHDTSSTQEAPVALLAFNKTDFSVLGSDDLRRVIKSMSRMYDEHQGLIARAWCNGAARHNLNVFIEGPASSHGYVFDGAGWVRLPVNDILLDCIHFTRQELEKEFDANSRAYTAKEEDKLDEFVQNVEHESSSRRSTLETLLSGHPTFMRFCPQSAALQQLLARNKVEDCS
jgi:hypothetical protein